MKKFVTLTLALITTATMAMLSSCDVAEAVLPYVDVEGIVGELEDMAADIENGSTENGDADNNEGANGKLENGSTVNGDTDNNEDANDKLENGSTESGDAENNEGTNGDTGNDDTENSDADNSKPADVRRTATKEEWINAMMLTNFSVNKSVDFLLEGNVIQYGIENMMYDGKTSYIHIKEGYDDAATDTQEYYAVIRNQPYSIQYIDGEFYATETEARSEKTFGSLWFGISDFGTFFDSLVYSENTQSYSGEYVANKNYKYFFEVRFENGKLVKADVIHKFSDTRQDVYSCFDFGTTKVNLPEYKTEFKEQLSFKLNSAGDGYEVTGIGTFSGKELVIPESYLGKPVVAIGSYALRSSENITSVVIPDTVESIGEYAFNACYALKTLVIGSSVTRIDYAAFSYCTALEDVMLPETLEDIDAFVFRRCNSLKTVKLPANLKTIGEGAFVDSGLTTITIPESVETIGACAFSYCNNLLSVTVEEGSNSFKSVDGDLYTKDGTVFVQYATAKKATSFAIPSSVVSIASGAFANNCSLETLAFPASLKEVKGEALYNVSSLVNIVVDENNEYFKAIDGNLYTKNEKTLVQYAIGKQDELFVVPETVIIINEYAFARNQYLKNVTLNEGLIIIGMFAFEYSGALESIVIPNKVERISQKAFYRCSSLTSVSFGRRIYSIYAQAFEYCYLLKNATYSGTVAEWNEITMYSDTFAYSPVKEVVCWDGSVELR